MEEVHLFPALLDIEYYMKIKCGFSILEIEEMSYPDYYAFYMMHLAELKKKADDAKNSNK